MLAAAPAGWSATQTNRRAGSGAPNAADSEAARQLQQQRAAEREALRDKLVALKRDIAASEANRSEVADALATSERSISDANRKLRDLGEQQRSVQADLTDITARQLTTQRNIGVQQAQLGELLRKQYMAGAQDPFKLLFSGDDPNRIQRDLHYLAYLSRAQADVLRSLRGNLDELKTLGEQAQEHDAELAAIADKQQSERATLLKEQDTRRATLAKISDKLRGQRREAGALERDEKRLARVVDELARLIERQAREREAARLEAARQEAARVRQKKAEPVREPERREPAQREAKGEGRRDERHEEVLKPGPRNDLTPEAGDEFTGNFAKLRGKLRLPVKGELGARFGATRPDGGPTWKGIFIRAPQGGEVKAVAPGRVVFAEWLRGFGNLLIVDHGGQYLSIYGNNESLFKQPGDRVQVGDVLAAVGNSGGNPETGLYFELRFQGRPFDPLLWSSLR